MKQLHGSASQDGPLRKVECAAIIGGEQHLSAVLHQRIDLGLTELVCASGVAQSVTSGGTTTLCVGAEWDSLQLWDFLQ